MFYLRDVGIFLIFLLVLGALSWRVWRRSETLGGLEATVLTIGFVLGSSGLLIWLIGLTIGVGFVSLLGFLMPCAAVFVWSRNPQRTEKAAFWRVLALDEKVLALYLFAVFAMTFMLCLAPPVGNDYDSLMYHLAAPAQYLRAGKIVVLPYDHHTFFPLATEMLFLLGLKLSGPVLAKLFHWLMMPLCCATMVAVAQRNSARRAGLFAATLFAAIPLVQNEATTAYIDLALVAYTLLAFLCFARWMNSTEPISTEPIASTRSEVAPDNRWLLACGVFCGFGLGAKYFGLIPLLWFLLATMFLMARRRKWQVKPLATMLCLSILVGGGWYARNFSATGNPVFPFAYNVFGGRGWSADRAAQYAKDVGDYGFGKSPSDLVWLPWRVSMSPLNAMQPFWPLLSTSLTNGKTGFFEVPGLALSSFLGPALLALGAPLVLVRRKPRLVRFAGWSALFFAIVWVLSSQTIRYALPIFALLCWPCGWGLEFYAGRCAILKWTACAFFVAWILCSPVLTLWQNRAALSVALGQQTPIEYSMRRLAGFAPMQWASQNTPINARFAVYGEPRCFYLERDYFWADAPQNMLIDYSKITDANALIQALKANGATHVLLNAQPARNGGFGAPPSQFAQAVGAGLLTLKFEKNGYIVYEIDGR